MAEGLEAAALLTVDVQVDFTDPDGAAPVDGTAAAVPRMRRLVEAFRDRGRPIVHVVRLYRPDGSNAERCRREQVATGEGPVRPGTRGADLVDALKPTAAVTLEHESLLEGALQELGPGEWAMYKPRWSAFYRTDLEAVLDERSVETVVVCGCNFPNCPRATIYDASARDYRIALATDGTSGVYQRGLADLEAIGVRTAPTEELVRSLE